MRVLERDQQAGDVTLPNGTTASYGYDADGRRVTAAVNASSRTFVWDVASTYGDVVAEFDGGGTLVASYVLGHDRLISQTQSGSTAYFAQDALGSTRALTDATGAVTETYTYSAYGTLIDGDPAATEYLYTGHRYDTTSGLYQMRARWYDPGMGRFLTQDTWQIDRGNPVELNRYGYVAGNPVNATDPTGHFMMGSLAITFKVVVAFVVAAAAIALIWRISGNAAQYLQGILDENGRQQWGWTTGDGNTGEGSTTETGIGAGSQTGGQVGSGSTTGTINPPTTLPQTWETQANSMRNERRPDEGGRRFNIAFGRSWLGFVPLLGLFAASYGLSPITLPYFNWPGWMNRPVDEAAFVAALFTMLVGYFSQIPQGRLKFNLYGIDATTRVTCWELTMMSTVWLHKTDFALYNGVWKRELSTYEALPVIQSVLSQCQSVIPTSWSAYYAI